MKIDTTIKNQTKRVNKCRFIFEEGGNQGKATQGTRKRRGKTRLLKWGYQHREFFSGFHGFTTLFFWHCDGEPIFW